MTEILVNEAVPIAEPVPLNQVAAADQVAEAASRAADNVADQIDETVKDIEEKIEWKIELKTLMEQMRDHQTTSHETLQSHMVKVLENLEALTLLLAAEEADPEKTEALVEEPLNQSALEEVVVEPLPSPESPESSKSEEPEVSRKKKYRLL